jgi:hypothetical protein
VEHLPGGNMRVKMSMTIRRYHRLIAVLMCIPLGLTIITGMTYPIFDDWLELNKVAGFLLKVHSGRIFGLESIYPVLNGLGLAGLFITGLSMTSLFRQKRLLSGNLPSEASVNKELLNR